MTNETYEKIERYLENQDKSGNYDTISVFLSEINKRFELKFMVGGEEKTYTLSQFINNFEILSEEDNEVTANVTSTGYVTPGTMPEDTPEGIFFATIAGAMDATTLKALRGGQEVNWDSYINAINNLFNDLGTGVTTPSGENIQLLVGDEDSEDNAYTNLKKIEGYVRNWVAKDYPADGEVERPYSSTQPKLEGIAFVPQTTVGAEGEITFGSKTFYTGPNIAINAKNQFYDPITGNVKYNNDGSKILKPHFKRGSAAALFEGLTQEAIFGIQQDLVEIGMIDPAKVVFGVINPTSGQEINAIAALMTMANDTIALLPNASFIDFEATSLYGQLLPYVDFQKRNAESTKVDLGIEGLEQFASEVLPPTEAEVKSVVDELFAEKGIVATAADYARYSTIFGNLQSQAAARESEILKNKPSLKDTIAASETLSEIEQAKGNYVYPGFGVVAPTPEELRKELGMPLLQPLDPKFELSKIIDGIEEGRIDASSEIRNRSAAANEFKRNFMVFEENF